MMGLKVHRLLSPGAGPVILIAWAAARAAVGIALTARRDDAEVVGPDVTVSRLKWLYLSL